MTRIRVVDLAAISAGLVCRGLVCTGPAIGGRDGISSVAFFGFDLNNSSLESATPVEEQRVRMLGDFVQKELNACGRFEIVPIPDQCGNTDESWRHGLDHMLRHYLFAEP